MRQFGVFRFESFGVIRKVYSTMRSAGIRPYKLYVQFQERKKGNEIANYFVFCNRYSGL